jgi:hypothetical protein
LSLSAVRYLKEEFKQDLVEQVSDPKISDKLSEIGGNVMSSDTTLDVSDVVSGYSIFGISIGLAHFLQKGIENQKLPKL